MKFETIVGQEGIKGHLIDEVRSQKVSHAQLFTGNFGFGGLPLALAFTQYLLCENKLENDSCGTCPSCHKIAKLEHPDVHFTFPTVQAVSKTCDPLLREWREAVLSNPIFDLNAWVRRIDAKERGAIISVDQSQEIIKKLSLRSYEGGYKVMIIWKAEAMNQSCANKLLKILEEPPAKTLFLLLTEEPDSILPTIRSRTQIVRINAPDFDQVSRYLVAAYQLNTSLAESIAARSEGDLIKAAEQVEAIENGEQNRELFIQLMRVCYKKNVIDMIAWAERMGGTTKMVQKDFLEYSLYMFRQSLLKNYTGDQMTRVSEDENAFLTNFAKFITGNNIHDFMDSFSKAHYHLERNANAELLFTDLCFNVMRYIHAA